MGLINIYFTDFFGVPPDALEEYGAFDVSLVGDLPLFVDPFLLFNSENPAYQALHSEIIRYMRFLKDVTCSDDYQKRHEVVAPFPNVDCARYFLPESRYATTPAPK
jgi:hypothetical protein